MEVIHQRMATQNYGDYFTNWIGTPTGRSHTLGTKLRGVIADQLASDVTTISIRGREDTGKTTLAFDIAHIVHTELMRMKYDPAKHRPYVKKHLDKIKNGYVVRLLTAEDLMNFRDIIESLPPNKNRILIFDDLSFIKKLETIKSEATRVRHLKDNKDVKVLMIYNFHYTKAFDKYLRDTGFIFQTSISGEEIKNVQEVLGNRKKYNSLVNTFARKYPQFRRGGHVTLNLAPKNENPVFVKYVYSEPYRLGIFYDSMAASFFVWPSMEALEVDKCPLCMEARTKGPHVDASKIMDWIHTVCSSERKVTDSMRLFAYITLGYDPRYDPETHRAYSHPTPLGILQALVRNNITHADDLIKAHFKLDRIPPRQPHIPYDMQRDFDRQFGTTRALAAPGQRRGPPQIATPETESEAADA